MCGRATLISPAPSIADAIGGGDLLLAEDLAPLTATPHHNLAPTQQLLCARPAKDRERLEPVLLRWGLVPYWEKDLSGGAKRINARAETVFEKPAFRKAVEARRCLAILDGFYEWHRPAGGRKQPWYFTVRGGRPFAVAALWERWFPGKDEAPVETCSLLTTGANALLASIHDRMPVILEGEGLARWLDREAHGREALGDLLAPLDASLMEGWPVSSRVNSAENDDPGLIAPVTPGEDAPPAAPEKAARPRASKKKPPTEPPRERHEQGTLF